VLYSYAADAGKSNALCRRPSPGCRPWRAGLDGVLFANWLWACGVDCPVGGECMELAPNVPVAGTLPDVFGSLSCRDRIDRVYAATDPPNCQVDRRKRSHRRSINDVAGTRLSGAFPASLSSLSALSKLCGRPIVARSVRAGRSPLRNRVRPSFVPLWTSAWIRAGNSAMVRGESRTRSPALFPPESRGSRS
jgi:hypothetical protein